MKPLFHGLALLSTVAILSSPTFAFAQARPGSCSDDAKTYCSDAEKNGTGATLDCLKAHSTMLKPGCAATMQRVINLPGGAGYSTAIPQKISPSMYPNATTGGSGDAGASGTATGTGSGGTTGGSGGGSGTAPSN